MLIGAYDPMPWLVCRVERKYFVKLLCTIFYFRKLLDMYEARSGPAASRDKAMLVELREFQWVPTWLIT